LNADGKFAYFCNRAMVELEPALDFEDQEFIREHLEKHLAYTGSPVAQMVLDHWHDYLPRFVKVLPLEYKRILQEQKLRETQKLLDYIRDEEYLEVSY
jgi:glutamate synthase (NADPH/NADH) large chain